MSLLNYEGSGLFAFTGAPSRLEFRIAGAVCAIIVVLLVLATPFARIPLPPAPAFVGAYAAWFALAEAVIAFLMFALFLNYRSPGLFALAAGSLLMPLALVFYISTHGFPSPRPTAGSGLATLWGAGFPFFVLLYVGLGGSSDRRDRIWRPATWRPSVQVAAFIGVSIVTCAALGAVITPVSLSVMAPKGGRWPVAYHVVCFVVALAAGISFAALALRRSRSVLDLWLMVEMAALGADLTLNGFSDVQYDFGWYAGRAFGLVAASSLLLALLIESAAHYGRLAELNEALVVSNRALEHLSLHDGLTGLPNRRYFDTYLGRQVLLMRRRQQNLALVLIDVDSFKAYNDLYGHQAGDECLSRVAVALKSCCRRPAEMAARYGGEEFALILPDTDFASAMRVAESAREAVLKLKAPHSGSATGSIVSISGGIAMLGRGDAGLEELVAQADEALFIAKTNGRNQMASALPADQARRA